MQQRYYDPQAARFLSVDPMAADTGTGWNFNRYNYAANNPYKFKDPDGRVIETPWDVANIAMDVVSIGVNVSAGNYVSAVVDMGALAYDLTATAVPGLPAGAGAALKVARSADNAREAIRASADVGGAGESAAGILKNTTWIPSASRTAAYRVPDGLTAKTLTEVKNYSGTLRLTNQLRDFMAYANDTKRSFELVVGKGTKLSKSLQELVDKGSITLRRLE